MSDTGFFRLDEPGAIDDRGDFDRCRADLEHAIDIKGTPEAAQAFLSTWGEELRALLIVASDGSFRHAPKGEEY